MTGKLDPGRIPSQYSSTSIERWSRAIINQFRRKLAGYTQATGLKAAKSVWAMEIATDKVSIMTPTGIHVV